MGNWNKLYSKGSIHRKPSKEVINLITRLKQEKVYSVLDAGCGTGRHTKYLAEQGFYVQGIDISKKAIEVAESQRNGHAIDYSVGSLDQINISKDSFDFILANHSLQYSTKEGAHKSIKNLQRLLRPKRPFFARVSSTEHPFHKKDPDEVYGFSHIGFCIKNGLPVHFFEEEELRELFSGYKIERLEHINHEVDHDKISVPLSEWIIFGYKK